MELFRVGDIVDWCGKLGEVTSVGDYEQEYPLRVDFGHRHIVYFTSDGKSRETYKYPSLINITLKNENTKESK